MENLSKLGIDIGSLIIYLANFGLLWLILAYMVFPKIIKTIDARRNQIQDNLSAAEMIQTQLDDTLKTAQSEKAELVSEIATERKALEADLSKERVAVLKKAEEQSEQLVEQARGLIREERGNLMNLAKTDLARVIRKGVEELLRREVDDAAVEQSLATAWEEYRQEAKL